MKGKRVIIMNEMLTCEENLVEPGLVSVGNQGVLNVCLNARDVNKEGLSHEKIDVINAK